MRGSNLTMARRLGLVGGIGLLIALISGVLSLVALNRLENTQSELDDYGDARP